MKAGLWLRKLIVVALLASVAGGSVAQSSVESAQIKLAAAAETEVSSSATVADTGSTQSAPAQTPAYPSRRNHKKLVALVIVGGLLLFVVFAAIDLRHS